MGRAWSSAKIEESATVERRPRWAERSDGKRCEGWRSKSGDSERDGDVSGRDNDTRQKKKKLEENRRDGNGDRRWRTFFAIVSLEIALPTKLTNTQNPVPYDTTQ